MPRYGLGLNLRSPQGGYSGVRYPPPGRGGYGSRNPLMYGTPWDQPQGEDLSLPPQQGTQQGIDTSYNGGVDYGGDNQPTGLFNGRGGNLYETLGIAANAISPNTVGGRLGGAAASYSMQNRADQRQQGLMDAQNAYRQEALNRRVDKLNVGQGAYGIRDDGTYGLLAESPRTPSQSTPLATPIGSSRPGYTDPATGIEYPPQISEFSPRDMQLREFSPREQQLRPLNPGQYDPTLGISAPFSPRDTQLRPLNPSQTIPAENRDVNVPYTAPGTFRQENIPVGPGGSLVGKGGKVTTVPQTVRQSTATVGAGTGGKPPKPTQFDKEVENWVTEFQSYQPTKDETYAGGWLGTPSVSPQQQALQKIKQMALVNTGLARSMQQAYLKAFGGGATGQGNTKPTGGMNLREGDTATGAGGQRIIWQNGAWVPYGR